MSAAIVRRALRKTRASQLGGLAGDSFYVAIWQAAISVADLVQIALIAHALGLHELGRLALVMSFVVLVGQLFDVRVGVAATTFGARKLDALDFAGAEGIFRLSYRIDALTGLLGFAVVLALAPVVGPHLVGADGTWLIILYALTLLASTVHESSISILRLLDRFRLIAGYTVGLEAIRVALVAGALAFSKSLAWVLIALVAYYLVGAVTNVTAAGRAYRRHAGRSLRLRSQAGVARSERRAMVRTVLQTNLVSYARITQVQLPTILIGALSGATQVGIYKVGTAAAAIVAKAADPAYTALLPRIARLWAAGRRAEIRGLIAWATAVAAPVMGILFLALFVARDPVLELLGGGEGATAGATVLVLAAMGYAINGALFWNVGVLFAAQRTSAVAVLAVVGGILQVVLLLPLVALFEASGAAAALLGSLAATNAVATVLALRVLAAPETSVWRPARPRADLRETPPRAATHERLPDPSTHV